ncbi:DUF2524 domain-containing protein [Cohnella endophytica]|uniref:DUF2524 domain-containing protein n=1 Tax=Cohnella endophytica TaxID=2419778 RepID=A0A494XHP8_9BACL|nr:DUF2524 domain-containing protein [Cohnella endophytica]RKP50160.1 DUF2524 domain-containing protein [Cohnella endophytica]
MLNELESNYDCSNAGDDLHQLKQELEQLLAANGNEHSAEMNETKNRLENQIHFIQNKCDIH